MSVVLPFELMSHVCTQAGFKIGYVLEDDLELRPASPTCMLGVLARATMPGLCDTGQTPAKRRPQTGFCLTVAHGCNPKPQPLSCPQRRAGLPQRPRHGGAHMRRGRGGAAGSGR